MFRIEKINFYIVKIKTPEEDFYSKDFARTEIVIKNNLDNKVWLGWIVLFFKRIKRTADFSWIYKVEPLEKTNIWIDKVMVWTLVSIINEILVNKDTLFTEENTLVNSLITVNKIILTLKRKGADTWKRVFENIDKN